MEAEGAPPGGAVPEVRYEEALVVRRHDLACGRCGAPVSEGRCAACRRLRDLPPGPPRELVAALLAVLVVVLGALAGLGLEPLLAGP